MWEGTDWEEYNKSEKKPFAMDLHECLSGNYRGAKEFEKKKRAKNLSKLSVSVF